MPNIVDEYYKINKFSFAFDFLFLLQEKFNITVFDFIGVNKSFNKQGIQFNYLKRKHNNKVIVPWSLFFKIKKLNPDYVYIQSLAYPHFILLLSLFLKNNCKVIVQDHADSYPSGLKKTVFKWADKIIDLYFFTSKKMTIKYVEEGLISSESKIIECVEGSTQFKFNPNPKKDPDLFLWVGRLDSNKDPLTILKAFKKYAVHNPKAKLKMFYENDQLLSKIKLFVDNSSLSQNVDLMGKIPHKELEQWYQKSTFFILGSHKEGGPISLVEAMACGCIPIVTNIAPFQAMTNNGDCGLLFSPGDYKELSQQLNKIESLDIEKLRNKTLSQFEHHLSHQAIASKITKTILGS